MAAIVFEPITITGSAAGRLEDRPIRPAFAGPTPAPVFPWPALALAAVVLLLLRI